mgnify:CR=1 FL=1
MQQLRDLVHPANHPDDDPDTWAEVWKCVQETYNRLTREMEAPEEARERAGIHDWPSNALRHSYASYHLAEHKDSARLALELGHTNSALIFRHYRELVKPKDAARWWQIMPTNESSRVIEIAL